MSPVPETNDNKPLAQLLTERKRKSGNDAVAQAFVTDHLDNYPNSALKVPAVEAGQSAENDCLGLERQQGNHRKTSGAAVIRGRERAKSPAKLKPKARKRNSNGGIAAHKAAEVYQNKTRRKSLTLEKTEQAVENGVARGAPFEELSDRPIDPYRQISVPFPPFGFALLTPPTCIEGQAQKPVKHFSGIFPVCTNAQTKIFY